VKSALWGFELKSGEFLGVENFSCVTAILGQVNKKMCVTAALWSLDAAKTA